MFLALLDADPTSDRGFLFGWPDLSQNEPSFARRFISRYHGYVIFWGICFTFWYHPMESTPGHFLGFTNGCLCFLQSSMIYTKMHVTKQWTFFIELWPLIHSCVIAYQTGNRDLPQREDLWPIFFFGFTTVLVIAWIFTFDLLQWRDNSEKS
ncbi:unnamed protein product [Oikopleura dioica]|uniref:Uncharacterized protein n=1 Tax=Oikopleura dioica TaxID=34765 RepID=E4XME2_OIKDI|nr:unnamed protein product [Oikopleura dioica]